MDETTKRLWVEADAATLDEARSDAALGKHDKNDGRAAVKRHRAWQRLETHRRRVHRAQIGGKDAVA